MARTKTTRPKGSGIPARGAGWGGDAKGVRPQVTAETQPTFEARVAGHAAGRTARDVAKSHAVAMAELLATIANDATAPHGTRVDAANKLIERAEGKPALSVGGSDDLGPIKHVVTWEDE